MIYEHFVSGGWVGFDTQYSKRLQRKVPMLWIGIPDGDKIKKTGVFLYRKNTEILPDLHKAIGCYLEQRNKQETSTGNG